MTDIPEYIATGPWNTVEVDPIPLGNGLLWRWQEVIDTARADCPDCDRIPCWRHAAPDIDLVGFDYQFGPPELDRHGCYSGAALDRCAATGGITVQGRRGMVASACEPCAAAHLGVTP